MKLFRSRLFLTIIGLLIAAVVSFVLLPNLYESQSSTVAVVQLVGGVPAGTEIKDYMLTTKQIGAYGIDGAIVKDKKDIIGKYAAYQLRGETLLYKDQFVDAFAEVDGAAEYLLKPGEQLMTVTVGAAASVGGQIKTGSIVDIYTQNLDLDEVLYDDYGFPINNSVDLIDMGLDPLLSDVCVFKVLNGQLEDVTELQREWRALKAANDSASEDYGSALIPAYVTLIVNAEQAELLAQQQYNGKIHLVLSPDKGVSAMTAGGTASAAPAQTAAPAEEPAPETEPATANGTSSGLLSDLFNFG